jgi:peptidoglycan/xylan/chitin deacetylase (PgdA/CDA1 family)
VVLTFDDGRGSVWSVGGPFLRRYGMKGIVFLVPDRVSDGECGPTWDDAQAGRARPEDILKRETNGAAFLNWAEVMALRASGVFEFESHSLTHARVHTAPLVAGFVTPGLRQGYSALDLPLVRAGNDDLLGEDVPLGTPILRSESRLGESLRFFEDPAIRADCVALVRDEGEEGFFLRPDWEARLRRLVARRRIRGEVEALDDREAAQARELRESKRRIEERTGRPVIHLCYPWHVSGPTARRLAREAGYRTAFAGKVPGTPITRAGGDPLQIARIGEDYVELLPGRGRDELSAVLQRKWSRRLRGAT